MRGEPWDSLNREEAEARLKGPVMSDPRYEIEHKRVHDLEDEVARLREALAEAEARNVSLAAQIEQLLTAL